MRQLYHVNYTYKINGHGVSHSGGWHYAEVPSEIVKQITWDDLMNLRCGFITERKPFSKKYRVRVDYDSKWYTQDTFESAAAIQTPYIIKRSVTIYDLAKRLPADEFIEYCKDNGLSLSMPL